MEGWDGGGGVRCRGLPVNSAESRQVLSIPGPSPPLPPQNLMGGGAGVCVCVCEREDILYNKKLATLCFFTFLHAWGYNILSKMTIP
jgi:hypothetical protein